MGVIKRLDSDYWHIEFIHDGVRLRTSSHTSDKTKARAIETRMRAELLAGNDPGDEPGRHVPFYLERRQAPCSHMVRCGRSLIQQSNMCRSCSQSGSIWPTCRQNAALWLRSTRCATSWART